MMEYMNKENIELSEKEIANVSGGSHIILPDGSDDALKPTPGTGTVLKPVRSTITIYPDDTSTGK